MEYNGFNITTSDYAPKPTLELLYLSGKKDGNKLGKRKRSLKHRICKIMIQGQNVIIHTSYEKEFLKRINND